MWLLLTNQRPVFRLCDHYCPIRVQYPGHVIIIDQSEASIQVMWSLLSNQRPLSTGMYYQGQVLPFFVKPRLFPCYNKQWPQCTLVLQHGNLFSTWMYSRSSVTTLEKNICWYIQTNMCTVSPVCLIQRQIFFSRVAICGFFLCHFISFSGNF